MQWSFIFLHNATRPSNHLEAPRLLLGRYPITSAKHIRRPSASYLLRARNPAPALASLFEAASSAGVFESLPGSRK